MTWNEGLSGTALEIASSTSLRLWVAAGPGTGKTYALMRRLVKLLEVDAVEPSGIYLCTFTRTAAADLARKAAELGVPAAAGVETSTIHSYCFGLLSHEAALVATGRNPRTLLRFEERYMRHDLKKVGSWGLIASKRKLLALSADWARLQHEEPGWPRNEDDRRFKSDVDRWLRFHRAMLVGEIIPEAHRYLRDNPLSPFRGRFAHMLVDEYQDLNKAEQEVIELLAGASVVVIGDEDQSIYSFKYAHPRGITDYPSRHVGTETKVLDECRRCPANIVTLANTLISENVGRQNRQMRLSQNTNRPASEIHVVQWRDSADEVEGIAQFVHHRVTDGRVAAGEVLVLVSRGEFGVAIRDRLRLLGTSANSFFAEEAFDPSRHDDEETKAAKVRAAEAFTLIQLLADPQDRVALRCWCGFGDKDGNAPGWKRVWDSARERCIPPSEVLAQLVAGTTRIAHTDKVAERYRLLVEKTTTCAGLLGSRLRDEILPDGASWATELRDLVAVIPETATASELGSIIKAGVMQPELPTDVEYVRVMSLHKSKGLTADLVVIAGCVAGLLPRKPKDEELDVFSEEEVLEEQRRLFYVGMTRAAQTLVLSHFRQIAFADAKRLNIAETNVRRRRNGPTMVYPPASRFISELGPTKPRTVDGSSFLSH